MTQLPRYKHDHQTVSTINVLEDGHVNAAMNHVCNHLSESMNANMAAIKPEVAISQTRYEHNTHGYKSLFPGTISTCTLIRGKHAVNRL